MRTSTPLKPIASCPETDGHDASFRCHPTGADARHGNAGLRGRPGPDDLTGSPGPPRGAVFALGDPPGRRAARTERQAVAHARALQGRRRGHAGRGVGAGGRAGDGRAHRDRPGQGRQGEGAARTSPQRLAVLPDMPTGAQAGLEDFTATNWFGIAAPKGTPQAIVDRMKAEVAKASASLDLVRRFADQGADVGVVAPADVQACVRSQVESGARSSRPPAFRPNDGLFRSARARRPTATRSVGRRSVPHRWWVGPGAPGSAGRGGCGAGRQVDGGGARRVVERFLHMARRIRPSHPQSSAEVLRVTSGRRSSRAPSPRCPRPVLRSLIFRRRQCSASSRISAGPSFRASCRHP